MSQFLDIDIKFSTLVRAPREKIYDAFATADGLNGWFTQGATLDARPGGEIVFRWRDWGPARENVDKARVVIEARRPDGFVFRWGNPDSPTTVEMEFIEDPGGTVVKLRDHGYLDTREGRRALVGCASGWGEALTLLKFHVEHGLRY